MCRVADTPPRRSATRFPAHDDMARCLVTIRAQRPLQQVSPALVVASTTLCDRDVLRAVSGAGMYLAALAILAIAIGALVRHSATFPLCG